MRAIAPGKLVLTGAYAVLDGAPAIVAAVDRYVVADAGRPVRAASPEILAAFGEAPAPHVDASALVHESGRKLGLGSSAAALVASLAACALERGDDLDATAVRRALFSRAREAHARAQGGGSGIDVAASVFGGLLRYRLEAAESIVEAVAFPPGLVLCAFFTGQSARTSELLDRVAAARRRDPAGFASLAAAMDRAAVAAADALEETAVAFVRHARGYGALLARLGDSSDVPIVPPSCRDLAALAEAEHAAFYPAGAGGGDVAVWLGPGAPSRFFSERASALGFCPIDLGLDAGGVRRAPPFQQGN